MLSPLALCLAKNYALLNVLLSEKYFALCYRLWRFASQRIVYYELCIMHYELYISLWLSGGWLTW